MELTAIQYIVDAWQNTGQVGFEMWFSERYKHLIEQERRQIIEAWENGNLSGIEGWDDDGIKYYNKKFTDKKQQQ